MVWYKININEKYPRLLLDTEWEVKTCKGRPGGKYTLLQLKQKHSATLGGGGYVL